jgi:hypothetical protein
MLVAVFFFSVMPPSGAALQAAQIKTNLSFAGNDVDFNGVIWAGDKNFGLWKSTDNGASFQFVYRLPGAFDANNAYSGLVWNVFVDSRGFIFASAGGTNGLFRSTNGGASFSQVLNTNGSRSESFYISMTEDNAGSLYTVTYTDGSAKPQLLKSTNGGAGWTQIGTFDILHFHNIKFNPSNGYLYAVTGEIPPFASYADGEKIFRSKDNGKTWSLVVDRNSGLGTVYLALTFAGSYVYVGQDYPTRNCQIHRFLDDGSSKPFTPQPVYTPPAEGAMPFMSGAYFNNTLVFGNCAEIQNGVTRVVASVDGVNWNVLASSNIAVSDDRWNMFTIHPRSGIIFATLKNGYAYQIKDGSSTPNPTPTPTATPTPTPTPTIPPTPTPTATPKPTPPPTPTPSPSPSPTATPISTPTLTPTPEPTATQTPTSTPPPTATPTPSPTATPTPSPQATTSAVASKPTPTPTLTPKPTVTPTPTPTTVPIEPTQKVNQTQTSPPPLTPPQASGDAVVNLYELAIITSVVTAGSLLSVALIRKRRNSRQIKV